MTKTNWNSNTKQKDSWIGQDSNKTAFSEGAKNKTEFSESSKQKTDSTFPGDGSYTLLDVLVNAVVSINDGECMVNGPLRVTTYSTGKENTQWV